jgi:S-adenosylmethionine-diacylglycerol 3-amino-3-carboxypropyl transferase
MSQTDLARQQLSGAVHQNRAFSRTGLQERAFSKLFQGLVYAQIWEDPVVDMDGLALEPGDNIVCIASGGCNMMSYLTRAPGSISAVDLSPAHVALNRLKIAAATALPDHAAFYDFFGHADRPGNPALYDRHIAPVLDAQSRTWWETRQGRLRRRIDMFAHGFYRFGALGRFITAMHAVSRIGGVDYAPLLAARTLEEQTAFFDSQIAPLFENRLVRMLARRRASLFGLGIPPAQFEKLASDGGGDIVPVLRERTRKLMCDFPISENYFAWAAFNRGYRADGTGPVPPYLEAADYDAVRAHAPRASIVNRSLTDMLADREEASTQAYVLLDAQDWMTDAQLEALWTQITRTATPGARVLFRTGGAPDILPGRVPDSILSRWRYQPGCEDLWARDRSAIYGGVHVYRFEG